jgi:hypothetical protein
MSFLGISEVFVEWIVLVIANPAQELNRNIIIAYVFSLAFSTYCTPFSSSSENTGSVGP